MYPMFLMAAMAGGPEQFEVVNKCPPKVVVVNRCPAPTTAPPAVTVYYPPAYYAPPTVYYPAGTYTLPTGSGGCPGGVCPAPQRRGVFR